MYAKQRAKSRFRAFLGIFPGKFIQRDFSPKRQGWRAGVGGGGWWAGGGSGVGGEEESREAQVIIVSNGLARYIIGCTTFRVGSRRAVRPQATTQPEAKVRSPRVDRSCGRSDDLSSSIRIELSDFSSTVLTVIVAMLTGKEQE